MLDGIDEDTKCSEPRQGDDDVDCYGSVSVYTSQRKQREWYDFKVENELDVHGQWRKPPENGINQIRAKNNEIAATTSV